MQFLVFVLHPGFVHKLQMIAELPRPSSAAMNFLLPSSFIVGMIQKAIDGSRLLTLRQTSNFFLLNFCLVKFAMWCSLVKLQLKAEDLCLFVSNSCFGPFLWVDVFSFWIYCCSCLKNNETSATFILFFVSLAIAIEFFFFLPQKQKSTFFYQSVTEWKQPVFPKHKK